MIAGDARGRAAWSGVLLLAALGSSASTGCGSEEASASDDRRLRARVVDSESSAPIAGALVSIENGGLYLGNPDSSRGNRHYVIGGRTGADGRFDVPVPVARLGLHVFTNDYLYAPWLIEPDGNLGVTILQKRRDAVLPKPIVTDLRAEPASAGPGETVRLTANVTAATPDDPLSDETLAIEPTRFWTAALDPPSPGVQGVGYPDGEYTLELQAPDQPGTYTYHVVTTSEGCVTSDALSVMVEVR